MTLVAPAAPDLLQPAPCAGYCRRCGRDHALGPGSSRSAALALMTELEEQWRLDLDTPATAASPRNSLDYLFGPARGQMFGVLECRRPDGGRQVLRAFSGQYNGQWQVAGWVPPLFDETTWQATSRATEPLIKELGRRLAPLAAGDPRRLPLLQERRLLSQHLMKELHAVYRLHNFRGQTKSLTEVFLGPGGLPTGAGDCCAPKLLNHAARLQLTPLGISEFYLGRPNRSATRRHGHFYAACATKCRPILGFLLCGLGE